MMQDNSMTLIYEDSIQKREKAHIGKKIFGIVFFIIVFSAVAYFFWIQRF